MESFNYIKKLKKSNYIQFSPNGDYIVSVSGNQIIIIDSQSFNELHVYKEIKHPGRIAFAFNSEKIFASESAIKKLGVFNLSSELSAKIYKVTNSNDYQDYNICFTPDNKKIICGIYNVKDNVIATLNLETSKVENILVLRNSFVNKIQYSDNDKSYLFSIFERGGCIIDGETYSTTYILKWKYPFDVNEPTELRTGLTMTWSDISYNSTTKQYALYDQDNNILIVTDITMSKELSRCILSNKSLGYFYNLNWSHDGEYIVMTFLNTVKIIRVKNLECIKEFKVSSGLYSEFSPDDKLLVIGTGKNSYIIDVSEYL